MHEGHRRRLYEKLKNGDNLYEHEILEMLLFNAYPRKNTNPVAHELLVRFPSISEVLSASYDELISVPGVGEQVALYLMCVGKCVEKGNNARFFASFSNRGDIYDFVKLRMRGHTSERLELYFIDKGGKLMRISRFTSGESDMVRVQPEEVIKLVSVIHPYAMVAAHNHPGGTSRPSVTDDDFTKQCQIICSMNNVRLYDHVILASDGTVFSYFDSGRLDEIEREYSIRNLIKNGK